MTDETCLAEGLVVPTDFEITGLNLNELVVGPTGSGKSFSNAYSRLLHTTESSVVVPIAKRELKDKFTKLFLERGYRVLDLNFAKPEESNVGYDPLNFINSEQDVIQLAQNLIGDPPKNTDPYWNNSSTSALAAEIALVMLNAKESGRRASLADVMLLQKSFRFIEDGRSTITNLDALFERAERRYPNNQASELWRTVRGLPRNTMSCVFSTFNTALDKVFSENIIEMSKKENQVSIRDLGDQKTILFITTSPMNKTFQNFVNIMYADLFRELFERSQECENARLTVPVHIICDDFACGSRIKDFEDYISIFRAAGISVTLLLQSESQLSSMYGEQAATTIINNCDTYVYMGGMDQKTCESVARRMNKPRHWVCALPRENVVVFRRSQKPYIAKRYQTLEDPIYQQMMKDADLKTKDK